MNANIKDKQQIDICLENIRTIRDNTTIFSGALNALLPKDDERATIEGFNKLITANKKAAIAIREYAIYMDNKYGKNEIEPMIDETHIFDDIKKESIKIRVE